MTYDQENASDPEKSVWVAASAGTGKTKILTDRVLRLLLQGVPPSKILCITYTNAAAAEMAERIDQQLGGWAVMGEQDLKEVFEKLDLKQPSEQQLMHARGLFLQMLDAPQRIRIQTIHGFCQSVLKQFPLESGVTPHFTLIDERTATEFIEKAKYALLTDKDAALKRTVTALAEILPESGFHDLLAIIINDREKFAPLTFQSTETIIEKLYAHLNVNKDDTEETLRERHFSYTLEEKNKLQHAVLILNQAASETNSKTALAIAQWLEDKTDLQEYSNAFLTTKNEPRKKLCTQNAIQICNEIDTILLDEQRRVFTFFQANQSRRVAECTLHIINLAMALLKHYQIIKEQHGYLDYDDLIIKTLQLFSQQSAAAWVLYKLDGGINHLLLDEAQDTSPEQWRLLDILAQEFFAGQSTQNANRTLFVVGDEKQSIYSFQGANPYIFEEMLHTWSRKLERAKAPFARVRLSLSFRSTEAILKVVDGVFAQAEAQQGLIFAEKDISHQAFRENVAGRVELWPLVLSPEEETTQPWNIATSYLYTQTPHIRCANEIAETIELWLKQKRVLPARGRVLEPGDILILMQKRGKFARAMLRALKQRNIPVAGADRLVITEHLAIMDVMALGDFLLLPQDDLTLAAVLRSPLIGLSENELFELAHGRGEQTLWQKLRESAVHKKEAEYLLGLLAKVDFMPPYELFIHILQECGGYKKLIARLGIESEEPLQEFLALALEYDTKKPPSLQGFLHWIRSSNTQIKRDMEKGNNEVRLMTVHGAKGLQSPIVFLADTASVPKPFSNTLFWTNDDVSLPLWSPVSDYYDAAIHTYKDKIRYEKECEYRRLLYVAMTRAEDELYITGWGNKNKSALHSWYGLIQTAFDKSESGALKEGEKYVVEMGKAADVLKSKSSSVKTISTLPRWATQSVVSEMTNRIVTPSHMDDGVPTLSPVRFPHARERGIVIHRLLQYLPDIPEDEREELALRYLSHYATALQESERHSLFQEVQNILRHPDFAFLWKKGSLAEVAVSGVIEDNDKKPVTISGQIDRMAITDKVIYILDYKTNKEAPENRHAVAPHYVKQMRAYYTLIQKMYPQKEVRCALLWTAIPKLMEIIF